MSNLCLIIVIISGLVGYLVLNSFSLGLRFFLESPDGDAILSSTEVSLLKFSVNFSMFAI